MDIGLSSEQLSLRDTVRDILRTECPPDAARQAMSDPERWRNLWKTVVDLGWTELAAPDAGDYGPVELAVVLEECGAAIAPIPLLTSVGLAAGALRTTGLNAVLTTIAGGAVATLAVHTRGSRLPGAPMTLRQGRLRGRAVAVPNLPRAELIVTLAKSDADPEDVVAAVVRCGDGVTVLAGESTDPAQPVADVEIDAEPLAIAPVDVESALAAPLVATGCAGSVDSPASTVTPLALPHRTTAATTSSGSASDLASVTISSARGRLGTATARPRRRPWRSVIGASGSRDPLVWTARVATTPPAMAVSTALSSVARKAPAASPTLLSNGIGAMAAPHSSRTTASSTGP